MEERKAPTDEKETRMFYEDQTVIGSIHPWDFFIRGTNRSFEAVPQDRLYRYIQRCAVDFIA